ncbi:MAG: c-type cytochrome [Aureibaculum sp.]
MRSILLITVFAILIMASCNIIKEENAQKISLMTEINDTLNKSDSYLLFKNNCYVCHSINSKNHDNIIAPPMAAVKRRYKMNYTTREEFIEAMVNWAKDPSEENALMFGAVQQFKLMPKQEFNEEDLFKIAAYIYDNEIEQPEWFEAHFNQEHNNRGKGKRMRGRM